MSMIVSRNCRLMCFGPRESYWQCFIDSVVFRVNMIHQALVTGENFEEKFIIFIFLSQLPSNIRAFPFRCIGEKSENQSRIKMSVSCTLSRETAVLFPVSCCLGRCLPRSLHQRDVGDSFSCYSRSPAGRDYGSTSSLHHFIGAVCVNSFGLWLRSSVAKCEDSASTLRQSDCIQSLQSLIDISGWDRRWFNFVSL